MMRIVFLDSGTFGLNAPMDRVSDFGETTFHDRTTASEVSERIADADVVVTNKVRLNQEHLASARRLRLIVVTATVADIIDLAAAEDRGIFVETTAGYSTESVAQFTMTLMLTLMSRVHFYTNFVASGQYAQSPFFAHVGEGFTELNGKNLGIVGLGRIGTRVAELGEAFGAHVSYYSTSGKNYSKRFARVNLTELLTTSDVVSIHAPRTIRTYDLFNRAAFELMRADSILINTGRGGIVNEIELADALFVGSIAGVALDVFEEEPLSLNSPLIKLLETGRVILTPHSAWGSDNAQRALADRVYQSISGLAVLLGSGGAR